jgi:hypothetical protein
MKQAEVHQHEKFLIAVLLINAMYLYISVIIPAITKESTFTASTTNFVAHLLFLAYVAITILI